MFLKFYDLLDLRDSEEDQNQDCSSSFWKTVLMYLS